MRRILLLLLLPAASVRSGDDAADVLAALCDDARARPAVRKQLAARGVRALALLDDLRTRVRSDEGTALVDARFDAAAAQIRKRVLAGERAWFRKVVRPQLARLSPDALWRLRLGRDGSLYFDVRAWKTADARRILEYLAEPDPPAAKAYESLGGMTPAEWAQFRLAFATGRPLRLRWFVWGVANVKLADALPWARPVWHDHGLKLGGNHDERGNARLPPPGLAFQIGVVLERP